ncbi:hypothetical protein TIFTF001_046981 [Ficus carica]|uniref:peroxidase n=1 Tax=Ficus carica TaxID=3494 RepID=A0AA88CHB9_FICCA|nr:hypothetical protein TIFTF001_046981 [Ficus carica]
MAEGRKEMVEPKEKRRAMAESIIVGVYLINTTSVHGQGTRLEATFPGVVSCADILALAERDAVVLETGTTSYSDTIKLCVWFSWQVPTGRRDGRVSLALEAIDSQKQQFATKGLNTQDLIALVGNDSSHMSYRLYYFSATTASGADPTINPSFVPTLRAHCPQNGDRTRRVDLDTGSASLFDTTFFANLKNGRGVVESDQVLWTVPSTRTIVEGFLRLRGAQGLNFKVEFAKSMEKMSNIGVKTGTHGEIRRVCTAVN